LYLFYLHYPLNSPETGELQLRISKLTIEYQIFEASQVPHVGDLGGYLLALFQLAHC